MRAKFLPSFLLIVYFATVILFATLAVSKKTAVKPIGCFPKTAITQLSEEYDPREISGIYLGQEVTVPQIEDSFAYVLGEQVGAKRIEVDLSGQRVYAYDGTTKLFEFIVSTGKWARTPKGTFTIQRKVRAQKMSGGSKEKGTYYYLPNVPWVMFFGNKKIPWWRGFSFHGTYWHNNFGQPMSHGCVNMKIPEAEQLYYWAPIGTPVVIY